jgi:hypothetical protein
MAMLSMAPAAKAGAKLTMKVSPAVAFAPANLVVRTSIEADADNRGMEIVAESPDFYRSSEMTLDGDRAPRTTTFEFKNMPPGAYDVTATLFDASGNVRTTATSQVSIISTSGERD